VNIKSLEGGNAPLPWKFARYMLCL
jgi:hypothetical protein